MKTKLLTIISTFILTTLSCLAETEVRLTVIDENRNPVEEAETWVWYANPVSRENQGTRITEYTDAEGKVTASESGPLGISIRVKKEGFYPWGHNPAKRDRFASDTMPEILERTVHLRRILNPIPLFFKRSVGGRIPAEKTWVGFDFEQGDWVTPHGEGKVSDILFWYEREFIRFRPTNLGIEQLRIENRRKFERLGEHWDEDLFREQAGIWDGKLEIAFPNEKEGLINVEDEFIPQSVLRMPHEAFPEGYQSTYSYTVEEGNRYGRRDDIGFFLRTRVVIDEDGEIISANYAKIYGDFDFRAVGYIGFTYYFNPEPNDRNLEFNGENLFPGGRSAMP